MSPRPDWMTRARCIDQWALFDDDAERGGNSDKKIRAAIDICRSCPVLQQCAEYAAAVPAPTGVWAGVLHGDRRRTLPACGTTAGYQRHLSRHEDTCQACRDAVAAYQATRAPRRLEKAG